MRWYRDELTLLLLEDIIMLLRDALPVGVIPDVAVSRNATQWVASMEDTQSLKERLDQFLNKQRIAMYADTGC